MEMRQPTNKDSPEPETMKASERTITIDQNNLLLLVEKICCQCRHPFLALRVLIHVLCTVDDDGQIFINARRLAGALDAHYDTVTKCLKFLREAGVLRIDR